MSIHVICPHCQSPLILPENCGGQTTRCPGCMQSFVIPVGPPTASFAAPATQTATVASPMEDQPTEAAAVWVVDVSERLLPSYVANAAGCDCEEFELLVIVQRKLDIGEPPAEVCRAMSGLVARLTRFCRGVEILDAICVATVREHSRDFEDWVGKGLYRSQILTTWRRVRDE